MPKIPDHLIDRILRGRVLTDSLLYAPEMGRLPFESASGLNNRALAALESGRAEEAEKLWHMALIKDPRHAYSLFNRDLYLMRAGRLTGKEALADLQEIEDPYGGELSDAVRGEIGPEPSPDMIYTHSSSFNGSYRQVGFLAEEKEVVMLYCMEGCYAFGARYSRDTGRQLWFGNQAQGVADHDPFRAAAVQPGGKRSAHLFDNGLIQIYSLTTSDVEASLQCPNPLSRNSEKEISLIFSPDGKMLAVCEPPGPELPQGRTTLINLEKQTGAAMNKTFVCMTKDNLCIVRGKAPGQQKPCLSVLELGKPLRNVFQFDQDLAQIREYQLLPEPFLCYAYQDSGEKFFLDASFRKHPMSEEMFAETENAPFYDSVHGRLYTWNSEEKLSLWDLESLRRLKTESFYGSVWRDQKYPWPDAAPKKPDGQAWLGAAGFVGGQWRVCLGFFGQRRSGVNEWCWSNQTLPSWWIAQKADWRRSPETAEPDAAEAKRLASRLEKELGAALSGGNAADRAALWREYRRIPEVYGTAEYAGLERAMVLGAEKGSLLSVREMGEAEPSSSFVLQKEDELTRLPGGRLLLCRTQGPGVSASVFAPDGTLIRKLPLPPGTVFAVYRKDRIYAFSPLSDCLLMDPDGKILPLPWEDWPQEEKYYDLDPEGSILIYRETKYGYGTILKNLDTGVENAYAEKTRINSVFIPPRFLADGRVVGSSSSYYVELYSREGGKEIKSAKVEGRLLAVDPDRRLIFIRGAEGNEGIWTLLDSDLNLLRDWRDEGGKVDYVFIPGTCLLAHCTEKKLFIRNYETGKQVFTARGQGFGQLRIRADGTELYARDGNANRVFRLEYDYAT